jgi:fatty-acid desaturase
MLISLMLLCAILASLAFGVLAAYGVCLGFFRLMAGRALPVHAALDGTPVKAEL